MGQGTRTFSVETLESRRLLSGTALEFGEAEAFSLQPSYDARSNQQLTSDGAGTVVRSLDGGRIAIHRNFNGADAGSSTIAQLDVPWIGSMALNPSGQLAVSWYYVSPRKSSGFQAAEFFTRVFQLNGDGSATPLTAAISIVKVQDAWSLRPFHAPIGIDAGGNATVVWNQTSNDSDVYAKRLLRQANGTYKIGRNFTVNTIKAGHQNNPDLALHSNGAMVIGWSHWTSNQGPTPYYTQQFDALGSPVGGQAQIIGDQYDTSLAADPSTGGVVAAWMYKQQGTSLTRYSIAAQRFSAAGAPLGAQLEVVADDPDPAQLAYGNSLAGLAVDAAGHLVVSYSSGRIMSDVTTQTAQGTERHVVVRRQVQARHLPAGSGTFAAEMSAATAYWEHHGITDASGTTTFTQVGEEVWASRPQVIGAGTFLLPYRQTVKPRVDESSHWYARTLVLVSTAATSSATFSDTTVEAEEELLASL